MFEKNMFVHTSAIYTEQKFTRDYWREQVPPVCGDLKASFGSRVLFYLARVKKSF
jgi:hypothetical protein